MICDQYLETFWSDNLTAYAAEIALQMKTTLNQGKALLSWYNKSYTQRMKTAISIPDSVFHLAVSLAKRMGMSRSELFRHALENYIEAHRHDRVREVLDAVYVEESSDIDEALAEMQWASSSKKDW